MLAPGARIGSFEVLAPLGAGGMGEVYRARDSRLGREVAIKVLPADRLADEGRRRRFLQEARAASALNHPHIVTIHEIGSADGIDFIVMEHVPGQTLDGLIPKSGMPVCDALRVAIPIADALAAAHVRGIVHRDLKPANVVVTREGVVKVLDFGLAKLVGDGAGDANETLTTTSGAALSRPGAITGTAAYMSPEQATGGKVDRRADVFAFGAVLYEMTTGQRAFPGRSLSDTLTAVVRDDPTPARTLVPAVPEPLERLIHRCLCKEPARRFLHMGDVKLELEAIRDESESAPVARPAAAARGRLARSALVTGGALIAAVAAYSIWRPRVVPPRAPRLVPLTALPGHENYPSLSPDGSHVAFQWDGERKENLDIYIQMIGSPELRPLTTDPGRDGHPRWSRDARQIAFVRSTGASAVGTLHVVSPLGGSERKLSAEPVAAAGVSWSPDGRWLATGATWAAIEGRALPRGIRLIDTATGEARSLTAPSAPMFHSQPAFSPNGKTLAFARCPRGFVCEIATVGLAPDLAVTGAERRLTRPGWGSELTWTRDGRSIVFRDGVNRRLWRVPASGDTPPEVVELAGLEASAPAAALFSDRLAFVRSLANTDVYRLVPGGRDQAVAASSFGDRNPSLSPDGRRFAFESRRAGEGDIWVATADGADSWQLTRGPGVFQGSPRWSPDGSRIAFDSMDAEGQWDIWSIDAQGGSLRRLTTDPADDNHPTWSRNGQVVYFSSNRTGGQTLWRVRSTGGDAEQVTRTTAARSEMSADGEEVYVQRLIPRASPLLAVSTADGGRERTLLDCVPPYGFAVTAAGIYHLGCGDSLAVPLRLLNPSTGRDRLLGTIAGPLGAGITVSADGKTVLFTKTVGAGSDLVLIEDFR